MSLLSSFFGRTVKRPCAREMFVCVYGYECYPKTHELESSKTQREGVKARRTRLDSRHITEGRDDDASAVNAIDSQATIMSSSPLCSPEADRKAFSEAVAAIAPDMPLMMHGSGDVPPSEVRPDTAALIAELTVQYIAELVDAAVDAHDILTDGAGGILPPPPLPNKRKPPCPLPPSINTRKRKKPDTDYWDEPLPEPKIRSEVSTQQSENKQATADEWVGVAGVDFWEESRSRKAHVTAPSAIGTQCFIFPICHDAGLYGRVMEVQAARRNIAPVLMDSVWLDMVNAEGGRLGSSTRKRPATPANEAENLEEAEEEDEENAEAELLPTWPGMESLLPVHRGG